ncbi:MAG: helix-turn-helix domain-containing protein [Dehalococcoidia bacterium]
MERVTELTPNGNRETTQKKAKQGGRGINHLAVEYAMLLEQAPDGSRISMGERLILIEIAGFIYRKSGVAFPSITTIAQRSGASYDTVSRHIKSLQSKGLLNVMPRTSDAGDPTSNLYRIAGIDPSEDDGDEGEEAHSKAPEGSRNVQGGLGKIRERPSKMQGGVPEKYGEQSPQKQGEGSPQNQGLTSDHGTSDHGTSDHGTSEVTGEHRAPADKDDELDAGDLFAKAKRYYVSEADDEDEQRERRREVARVPRSLVEHAIKCWRDIFGDHSAESLVACVSSAVFVMELDRGSATSKLGSALEEAKARCKEASTTAGVDRCICRAGDHANWFGDAAL